MKSILTLAFLAGCATAVSAQTASITWHDSVRDIYIDNEIDRSAQFLTSDNPTRAAIISTRLDKAVVLDIDSRSLLVSPRDGFEFWSRRDQ